ncbi:MAG: PQQ-binding-like beta-propeller repeat protein [Planctomycetia bacterium]|nr:PQQ-binding-like beta-propeller repeat protein [Planctomycetia bacterium]
MPIHFSLMRYFSVFLLIFLSVIMTAADLQAQHSRGSSNIISQDLAKSRGLVRQWETRLEMDASRDKLAYLKLYDNTLYSVTEGGRVLALNAETGAILWKQAVGKLHNITLEPDVSEHYLGVTNGAFLYILNRHTGKILLEQELPSAPATGPAITQHRAYIPVMNGIVYAYDLQPVEDPFEKLGKLPANLSEHERQRRREITLESLRLVKSYQHPLSTRAIGEIVFPPQVIREKDKHEMIAWTTDDNVLTVIDLMQKNESVLDEKFNVSIVGKVSCPLGHMPYDENNSENSGLLYIGTKEGHVICVYETDGEILWRFPTGEHISSAPAYVDGELFVSTLLSGMYCLDALSGGNENSTDPKWWAPHIRQFLSCSKGRVYSVDHADQLAILDRSSGQKIASLPIQNHPIRLTNLQTDRIYIATETGTVLCFRETALDSPINYLAPKEKKQVTITDTSAQTDTDSDDNGDDSSDADFSEDSEDDFSEDSEEDFPEDSAEEDFLDDSEEDSGEEDF